MAKKQEFKHLGFLGIFKESFNIIFSQPKIFTQITLFFILPLSFISIAITFALPNSLDYANIPYNTSARLPPSYNETPISNRSSSKAGRLYVLGFLADMLLSFIFSVLSVSTTAYTVISIKTGKDISFKKAMSIVPKVWKQVMCTHLSLLGINIVFFLIIFGFSILASISSNTSSSKLILFTISLATGEVIVSLIFIGVIFYTKIIWLLGDIVSVIEKISGIKALKKSKTLVKGKLGTIFCVILGLFIFGLPNIVFVNLENNNKGNGMEMFFYGIISLIYSTLVSMFSLVVNNVIYLVCKSYHHEPIDNPSLIGYIEVSQEDHLPLKKHVEDLQV